MTIYLSFMLAFIALCRATDLSDNLLRENHGGPTNEGTLFAVAFLNNAPNTAPLSSAILYVLNNNPTTAQVQVSLPHNPDFPDYPQTASIGPNSKHLFRFSTVGSDIRVVNDNTRSLTKGIRVQSTNNVPVVVVGSNSEDKSTDTFLALPCQNATTNFYKYFVFTSEREGTQKSQFVMVACEDETSISYSFNSQTSTTQLRSFQSYGVSDNGDITGTIISSNKPLAVFSGHRCGRIPKDKSACDHLVEQIPMHAVWGNTFFTTPFGYRGSGEFYRIGSVLDNNMITVTCTRRSGNAETSQVARSRTIGEGQYYEFQTVSSPVGTPLINYRRDFCCIETSKPAIVMQYMPGHNRDETSVNSIGSGIGDPSISIVPPVEQYRSRLDATTIDVTPNTEIFTNMLSWAVSSQFFDPANANEILFDNAVLNPGPSIPDQGGSGEYVPIQCSNGEVCGYGAFSPSPLAKTANKNFQLQFNSSKDPYAGIYFNLYGYVSEMSYAYPAGFEMEPIGLPRITVYNVTVPEDIGTVTVHFNRTGGDLSTNSRIFAQTRSVAGQAATVTDYVAVGETRLRWTPESVDLNPRDNPFMVTIVDDEVAEDTEYFEVFFNVDVNGYPFPGVARVTIIDNDGINLEVNFDPTTYTVLEGGNAVLTAVLNSPATMEVTVQVRTMDGTATDGQDYTGGDIQTLTFAAGDDSATLSIPVQADMIDELTERFTAQLFNAMGANIGSSDTSTIDITDNNVAMVNFDPTSYTVDEGGSVMATVVLSVPSTRPITVDVTSSDGTATNPSDYTTVTRTLTFQPGETSISFPVMTQTDDLDELQEQFSLMLANPTNDAVIGEDSRATVAINDIDSVMVTFDPTTYTVAEGDSVVTTVRLSVPSTREITVDVSSTSGTATESDYVPVKQTVTFAPGQTSVTVPVMAREDQIDENQEQFSLVLTNPTNEAVLGTDDTARVFIDDTNDVRIMFQPTDYTVTEGEVVMATVILSIQSTEVVTVDVVSSSGSATDTLDYTTVSQTLTFQPGERSASFPVLAEADQIDEVQEQFSLTLSNPSTNAMLGTDDEATVFINDANRLMVNFVPPTYSEMEGDNVQITAMLNIPADRLVTVDFTTNPGTADETDYTAVTQILTFQPGQTTANVNVMTTEDSTQEGNEQFTATLNNPTNDLEVGTASTATVDIVDDDVISVNFNPTSYTVEEGDQTNVEVVLSNPSSMSVTVELFTIVGTADGTDFTEFVRTVTFPPGTINRNIIVSSTEDSVDEDDEKFTVMLRNPTGGARVGSDDEAEVTIQDDDIVVVQFNRTSYSVTEGDNAVITVVTDRVSVKDIMVTIETSDDTAQDPGDYTSVSRVITIPSGQTSVQVMIPTTEDMVAEQAELFNVALSDPSEDAVLGSRDRATVQIDDDDAIEVDIEQDLYSIPENKGPLEVCITFSNPADRDVTITGSTAPLAVAQAEDGSDFIAGAVQFNVAAGSTRACANVTIVDDNIVESSEKFRLILDPPRSPLNLRLGRRPEAEVDIIDDDSFTVNIERPNYRVRENETTLEVCALLSNPSSRNIEVTASTKPTSPPQALATEDFVSETITFSFSAGENRACSRVRIVDDNVVEEPENFLIMIDPPSSSDDPAPGTRATSTVTIDDDDDLIVNIEEDMYQIPENGGPLEVCVELSNPASREVMVNLIARENSPPDARAGEDFQAVSVPVTFMAGQTKACGNIPIEDDNIREKLIEGFTVDVEVPPQPLPPRLGMRPSVPVEIEDDDSVTVRFVEENPVVSENSSTVTICLERVGSSEEDIILQVRAQESTPPDARDGLDFSAISTNLTIRSSESVACIMVPIIDDDIAMEPNRSFVLIVDPPRGVIPPGRARVTVQDDDVIRVSWEVPETTVSEDDGTREICFTTDKDSLSPYLVTVTSTGSSDNPALFGMDYSTASRDLIVSIPAGPAGRYCIDVMIINDNLALEDPESFTLTFKNLPPGVEAGNVPESTVTINDDDGVAVDFQTPDIVVNENGGTAEVCIERNTTTAVPMAVDAITSFGSASESDLESVTKSVVFAPTQLVSCVEVPIKNDMNPEPPEIFTVQLRTVPGSGVVTAMPIPTATVTIIDDDIPTTTACVIQNTLRISPFNARPSYQFRGTCELIALQSCNGSRPDFAVRVDYLSNTFDVGAVGVFKDDLRWVVKEDRSFFTTSSEVPVVSGNTSTYAANDVAITREGDIISLAVGDQIGVTITRSFADEGSIMISVSSESSLVETCGVCGTQEGQLLSPSGQITPVNASLEEKQAFVTSYRVPVSDHVLRPVRHECAVTRNGSVIGDPLFTVPFGTAGMNLCYEVHGDANTHFNLISDGCVNVNAHFGAVGDLNVMDSIGIRAEGLDQTCRHIRVDLENCAVSMSQADAEGSLVPITQSFHQDGISVRPASERVRITVPNCDSLPLVMWVRCQKATRYMPAQLRLQILRGVNLKPTSHGLLAQFWNIPITTVLLPNTDFFYNVTFYPVDGSPRSVLGERYKSTWDNTQQRCLYMGNGQGGPSGMMKELDDSVIMGKYKDYVVEDLFDTGSKYEMWTSDCTAN